ncbi:MAG: alpha/beta fold hydrolase [Chloroflexota bacterium]|nr:alpha/beta fold hydrolase [Chloroflexota bacterium]
MRSTVALSPVETRAADSLYTEHFIDAGGVRIRYIEAGVGNPGPPLVLLHGFQAGADYWLPHPLPLLAREFRIIAPDLPGFGSSGRLAKYSLDSYAECLLAFLDVLGVGQAYLLGHSMGAQIGIALAVKSSDRVTKLLLVDSAGLPRTGPAWTAPLQMLTDASTYHYKLYPKMFRLARKSTALRECLLMIRDEHVTDYLRKLHMPVLIIWGSRDRVVPLEHGSFLARNIPGARLAIIRGAGHMPFYQKPEQFTDLVLHFLKANEEQTQQRQGSLEP